MTPEHMTLQLREEYGKLKELAARVRSAVSAGAAAPNWQPEFRKTFEHFRAHLYRQFALEETDGYMNHVMDRRPTRARDVETLKSEHRSLQQATESLFAGLARPDLQPGEVKPMVDRLLSDVARHGQAENQLVLDVFGLDIGAGD